MDTDKQTSAIREEVHIGPCRLILGDCLAVLKELPEASVDAVVTDPPYGLKFMGKGWDACVPPVQAWREVLRVLKPGGHLLCFAGTRTQHRMASAIEDAGFEIRDMIAWVYGSGFPKSLDVSKAIDKAAGAEREVVGRAKRDAGSKSEHPFESARSLEFDMTAPATDAARQWQGWGTALKPALEPITVARKPFTGTVAANVLEHGTGAINVDACRVGTRENEPQKRPASASGVGNGKLCYGTRDVKAAEYSQGRWPANLIHDGSDEVTGLFPVTTSGNGGQPQSASRSGNAGLSGLNSAGIKVGHGDTGSAARFFYCAKSSKADRDDGCEGLNLIGRGRTCYDPQYHEGGGKLPPRTGNHHPTVKPTALMRYPCRLVTSPGGTVLDPFMGSGSTGRGAVLEGFAFVGIDNDPEFFPISQARVAASLRKGAAA